MRSTCWRAEASDRPVLMLVRASRTSSTVAPRRPPAGSSARKRRAVTSKLRWVWGELRDRSQDFSNAWSDSARVALTKMMGKLAATLGDLKNPLFPLFNCILIIEIIGYSSTASRSRREAVFRGHHSHDRCGFHSERCDRAFDAGAHRPFGAEPLARTRVRVRKFSVIALLKQLRRRLRSCHECRAPKK